MSFRERLDRQWGLLRVKAKLDWLGLETILVDILKSDEDNKLALIKEAIDAYTGRGHFLDEIL